MQELPMVTVVVYFFKNYDIMLNVMYWPVSVL